MSSLPLSVDYPHPQRASRVRRPSALNPAWLGASCPQRDQNGPARTVTCARMALAWAHWPIARASRGRRAWAAASEHPPGSPSLAPARHRKHLSDVGSSYFQADTPGLGDSPHVPPSGCQTAPRAMCRPSTLSLLHCTVLNLPQLRLKKSNYISYAAALKEERLLYRGLICN